MEKPQSSLAGLIRTLCPSSSYTAEISIPWHIWINWRNDLPCYLVKPMYRIVVPASFQFHAIWSSPDILLAKVHRNPYLSGTWRIRKESYRYVPDSLSVYGYSYCNVILNEKIIWYHNKSYIILFLYVHIIPTIMIVM